MLRNVEQREAMLAAILFNAADSIITIDEQGIVESANSVTEKLFGYTPEELLGQNIKMLMPAPYQQEHDSYLANYLTTGKAKIIGIGREVVGKRKDGSTFPMELAVSEIQVGDKRFFTGVVRDITERKKSEEQQARQLEAAQLALAQKEKLAMLGQVSGGIAHEIKNPLNAIKTSAYYLLNAHDPSPEKVKEHLARIDRQADIADNVISALSKFVKLPDPLVVPVEVKSCLVQSLTTLSMPDNIEVVIAISADAPLMLVDDGQLMIVFRNLIRNARDAMPAGGKLTFGVESNGPFISITVQDTGEGIPPEIIGRVLEPLYTTKARGMGLGLAISRAIVEKHQGELSVTSEVGVGSRFVVKLKSFQNGKA